MTIEGTTNEFFLEKNGEQVSFSSVRSPAYIHPPTSAGLDSLFGDFLFEDSPTRQQAQVDTTAKGNQRRCLQFPPTSAISAEVPTHSFPSRTSRIAPQDTRTPGDTGSPHAFDLGWSPTRGQNSISNTGDKCSRSESGHGYLHPQAATSVRSENPSLASPSHIDWNQLDLPVLDDFLFSQPYSVDNIWSPQSQKQSKVSSPIATAKFAEDGAAGNCGPLSTLTELPLQTLKDTQPIPIDPRLLTSSAPGNFTIPQSVITGHGVETSGSTPSEVPSMPIESGQILEIQTTSPESIMELDEPKNDLEEREKGWIRTNKSKGKYSRAKKIAEFDPKKVYNPLTVAPLQWGAFNYTSEGELEAGRPYTVKQIETFLYEHPLHQIRGPKESGLRIWIQRVPADSARRYPTQWSSKCRFSNCCETTRKISVGHFRVAFDEQSHKNQGTDPLINAGRILTAEVDGVNRMSLGHRQVNAEAVRFVQECEEGWIPRGYALHPRGSGTTNHQGSLTYKLHVAKIDEEPPSRQKVREKRGDKTTYHNHHLGNLDLLAQEREINKNVGFLDMPEKSRRAAQTKGKKRKAQDLVELDCEESLNSGRSETSKKLRKR
ncbi:MAG: hypothetical protein M1819_005898 [Sarea resinae]|nr:MAG: hypothetical protein M1819_005898 [Sarea resinae]